MPFNLLRNLVFY